MRVLIAQSVLADPKWFPILDVLILMLEDERHVFASEDLVSILNSNWLNQRPKDVRDILGQSTKRSSYDSLSHHSSVTLDVNCRRGGEVDFDRANTKVHPLDAIFFLSTPFQVIVENEWFDGAFLLWMAKAVDFTKLIDAYRRGRFIFRHAGGKGSILRSAMVFSQGVWARRAGDYHRALRLWMCVMLDNDARHPDDKPNEQLVANVLPHVAFVHELERRSIESYLPIERLKRYRAEALHIRKVEALSRLTVERRKHYHMKKGFRFETKIENPTRVDYLASDTVAAEEKSLFGTIEINDWNVLRDGFGSKLSVMFVDEAHRPNMNDKTLTEADVRRELLGLLQNIYKRI